MHRSLSVCIALVFLSMATLASAEPVRIAISQFVNHPALDAVNKGIKDDLQENGVQVEYKDYNANGNMATAGQIATQIASDQPQMVVAIATPVAQACANVAKKAPQLAETPLIFTAITDPIAAGLVTDYKRPGGNITGVSNQLPMDRHMEMIRTFMPAIKKLGVMFNAGEVNSVSNVKRVKEAAAILGIEIREAPVTASADVHQAAQSLVGKVDAVYVPTDNTVISALESVVKVCEGARLPLFVADTDSVKRGAIAAMGFDYYLHGKQTGELIRRILAGAKPAETPVEFQQTLSFQINPAAAGRMGLTIDSKILEKADKVY